MFRSLSPQFAVAGQLTEADLEAAASQGYHTVINNRPDGEEPGQPSAALLAAKANALGLGYVEIPVFPGQLTYEMLDQTEAAIAGANGPVLAFCRSGNRSATLWALMRARHGDEPADLLRVTANAGYDLSGLAATLSALKEGKQ